MAIKKIKRKKGERYNHTKVEADGLKFDSKKEYDRYLFLKKQVEIGKMKVFAQPRISRITQISRSKNQ